MELGTQNLTAIRVGKLIAAKRRGINMTQAGLAAEVGVTPGAVGQWESGRTLPTTARLVRVARRLGIAWNEIEAIYRETAA